MPGKRHCGRGPGLQLQLQGFVLAAILARLCWVVNRPRLASPAPPERLGQHPAGQNVPTRIQPMHVVARHHPARIEALLGLELGREAAAKVRRTVAQWLRRRRVQYERLRITGTRARPQAERSVSGACAGSAA